VKPNLLGLREFKLEQHALENRSFRVHGGSRRRERGTAERRRGK
jgi:hypothetical protein